MSFIDVIVANLVPHDCLGCSLEGGLLCINCLQNLPPAKPRCYRCRATTGYITCRGCRVLTPLKAVYPATVYNHVAKALIWKFKSGGAQEAAKVMAACMLPVLKPMAASRRTVIVAVPTATSRVRQRGFDQTRLVARHLARQAGLPWMDCLARQGQAHQVGAGGAQRRQQLKAAFRVSQRRFVRGAHIILLDDVVTTGSTLEAAARVLQDSGADSIEAVTFAQA